MAATYPSRIDICPWGNWEHAVGTWTGTTRRTGTELGNSDLYVQCPQNSEIGWKVALQAGTWNFTLIHNRYNAFGIATVKLDSTSLGTIDLSTSTSVDVVSSISGFTVGADGVYTLKLVMATKNGDASGYDFSIQHIVLQRTGA